MKRKVCGSSEPMNEIRACVVSHLEVVEVEFSLDDLCLLAWNSAGHLSPDYTLCTNCGIVFRPDCVDTLPFTSWIGIHGSKQL